MATHNRVQRWDATLGRTKDTAIVDNDDRVELDKPLKGNRGAGFRFRKLATTRNRLTSKDHTVVVQLTSPAANTQFLPIGAERFDGQQIIVCDGTGDAETNPITVDGGDRAIHGSFTHVHQINGGQVTYVYSDDLGEWRIVNVADRSQVTVGTYAALRLVAGSISGAVTPRRAYVTGRETSYDGGEGVFLWVVGNIATVGGDDGGYYLAGPSGSGGYWERVSAFLTPEMYGAKFDKTTDDTVAIQTAANAATLRRLLLQFQASNPVQGGNYYRITDTITWPPETCPKVRGGNNGQQVGYATYTWIVWDAPTARSGASCTVGASTPAFSPTDGNVINQCTVTGLSGMTATDVGSWICMPDLFVGNQGLKCRMLQVVAINSATSVECRNIQALTGTSKWMLDNRVALEFQSSECEVSGITVIPADGRYLWSGFQDIKAAGPYISANRFTDMQCSSLLYPNRYVACGIVHADWKAQPGFPGTLPSNWPYNGENNAYLRCQFRFCELAAIYCPNLSGQAQKAVIKECAMSYSPYGVLWESGGYISEQCDVSANTIACFAGQAGSHQQIAIRDCISEGSAALLKYAKNTGSPTFYLVEGGLFASGPLGSSPGNPLFGYDPTGFIQVGGTGTLTMIGAQFTAEAYYDANWKIVAYNAEGGPGGNRCGSVVAIGCKFPNEAPLVGGTQIRTMIGCYGFAVTNILENISNEIGVPQGDATLYTRAPIKLGHVGDQGADITAASAITLPVTGDFAKLVGGTTVNFISKAGVNAGKLYELYSTTGTTVNNNTGGAPVGFASILTVSGGSVVIPARGTFRVRFDGTNFLEV